MDPLRSHLLDLLFALQGSVPVTIGGGYGLFLKREELANQGERTLFEILPEPRATNDIDLFLRVDVLADLKRFGMVGDALRSIGCEPIAGAEFLQWKRGAIVGGVAQEVKFDILVGPLGDQRSHLHVKSPRVRPKGKNLGLHAHETAEALFIDDDPFPVPLRGIRNDGNLYETAVLTPQAFSYLMMKTFAFQDRREDANKDLGRHHALDLYTIVGLMTESEYERAKTLAAVSRSDEIYGQGRKIISEHFSSKDALGVIRLREHRLFRDDFQINEFVDVLGEIFL